MTIGGFGAYGSFYDVQVNQLTKAKNASSSDFSKKWNQRRKYYLSVAEKGIFYNLSGSMGTQ